MNKRYVIDGTLIKKFLFSKVLQRAKEVSSVPQGCHFSFRPEYEDGEFVIGPMKSGRKALIQIFRWTPSDPGDQHFYSYKIISYLKVKP